MSELIEYGQADRTEYQLPDGAVMMIKRRHILHDFDNALEALRADVLMMASLADRSLQNAMFCLLDRNINSCAITIADEQEINALEKKIDNDGLDILVRFQPLASDLRQVVATMKVAPNLERIADQAVKIARRSRNLSFEPELDEAPALGPMFIQATNPFPRQRARIRRFECSPGPLAPRTGSRH